MKLIYSLLLLLFISPFCFAQSDSEKKDKPIILGFVEDSPQFTYEECQGLFLCLNNFLDQSISLPDSLYRFSERNTGTDEQHVRYSFIVEMDGSISELELQPGPGSGYYTEELISKMKEAFHTIPKWKPGMHKGKQVRVQISSKYIHKNPSKRD